mgnify:CR=1 FL=1
MGRDVRTGWNDSTNNSTGITSISNNGVFYDEWTAGDSLLGTYRIEADAFKDGTMFYKTAFNEDSISLSFLQSSNPFGTAYDGTIDPMPTGDLTLYANAAAVPEPATAGLLMALVVLGFGLMKSRRRRRSC